MGLRFGGAPERKRQMSFRSTQCPHKMLALISGINHAPAEDVRLRQTTVLIVSKVVQCVRGSRGRPRS